MVNEMAITKKTTIKKNTKDTKTPLKKKELLAKKPKKIEEVKEEITENVTEETPETEAEAKKEKYFESVGRRKQSVARVRLYTKKATDDIPEEKGLIIVNEKNYYDYFKYPKTRSIVETPLKKIKSLGRFKATIRVSGGGIVGQAEAIKLGLARALVLFDLNFKKKLKKSGLLTRDARVKERKKYGLKKARRAPQWSKR